MLGAASSVGDAAPGASRASGLDRDGTRDQADVRVQVTAVAEMVQQLSQLVANQVAPAAPPPVTPCWEGCTRHPHKRHGAQSPIRHQTPMEMTTLHNVEFAAAVMKTRNARTSPYLTLHEWWWGGGGGSGQFPNADPSQAADPNVGMSTNDHAAYEESIVRVKDLRSCTLRKMRVRLEVSSTKF